MSDSKVIRSNKSQNLSSGQITVRSKFLAAQTFFSLSKFY